MLEKEIEAKVKKYARSKGWLCYKFVSPGHRSVPDDIFMRESMVAAGGDMFFIEFKAPGKKPTPKQKDEIKKIEAAGHHTYIVDNVGEGYSIIDLWEEE